MTLFSSFKPDTGDKAGKFKAEYKHEKFLFNADLNLASSPVVNMSTSVGHGAYSLGYQTAFDSGKSALTKHNLALAYNAGDMILHATATDSKVKKMILSILAMMINPCTTLINYAETSKLKTEKLRFFNLNLT